MSLPHITTHATGRKFHMGTPFLTVVSGSRKHHVLLINMNPGKRARSPVLGWLQAPVTFATDSERLRSDGQIRSHALESNQTFQGWRISNLGVNPYFETVFCDHTCGSWPIRSTL